MNQPPFPQLMLRYQSGSAIIVMVMLLLLVTPLVQFRRVAAQTASQPAGDRWAQIDAYVEQERQAARIPGLALGIVQGDKVVYLQGFGVANPSGRPVTPDTPFYIGSMSKSITAVAILQLREQGKLELDAPVQHYLPWFHLADAQAAAQITVRQLLAHTSGLAETTGLDAVTNRSDVAAGALERQVRAWHDVALTAAPGSRFQYSNANYVILGLLVETISGQSFEAYVQEHIFAPLGMAHAAVAPAAGERQGMATGHRYWFGVPFAADLEYGRVVAPAGLMSASVEEMTHYVIAQLNEGRYQGVQLLSPASIAEAHQPVIWIDAGYSQRLGYDDQAAYGVGWFSGLRNGVPVVAHSGDLPTYHADLVLGPGQRWGIVILMNANNRLTPARMRALIDGVTSLLLAGEPPPVPADDPTVMVIYRLFMGAALLQLGLIAVTLFTFQRWQRAPVRRPLGWGRWLWHLILPLIGHLLLALILLFGLPLLFRRPLLLFAESMPDLGYVALISGIIGVSWSVIRTIWVYRLLRMPVQPAAQPNGLAVLPSTPA